MMVAEEFLVGPRYRTAVWISKKADKTLKKFARKHRNEIKHLLEKVAYWAEQGFERFEGGQGYPIRHEGYGVYRLGHETLFRLLGFYENDDNRSFIIEDVILKSGQSLGKHERKRIRAIGRLKSSGDWTKGGK